MGWGASLQVTHDGGSTWNPVAPNINIKDMLLKLEFVDAATGWALMGDAASHHTLYKTVDGGVTWSVLIP